MEATRQRICDECGKQVAVSDLRYIAKGRNLLVAACSECRNKKNAPNTAAEKTMVQTTGGTSIKREIPQKRQYFCTLCKYKFKLDPRTSKLICPYCGKTGGVREHQELSSETLLKTSEGEE